MELIIAAEGFTLASGYIVKELTMLFPNSEYKHFIFKKPANFTPSPKDVRTSRYITNKLNELSFTEGDVPYNSICSILQQYKDYKLYTYSSIVQDYLQIFLPTTTIINIQSWGYKLPSTLPIPSSPRCFRDHRPRYCSLAKAKAISKFVETINLMDD